jgi:two-component system, chemotaxis family, sensor kinase CheA
MAHVRTPGPSMRSFVSIRTKLAAATVVVIAAVAVAGYVGLSNHERHNLLAAKESAALMMAGFFGNSLAPAIAFGQAADVQEGLANLGGNDDVVFAAVFGVDAERSSRVGAKLGELPRSIGLVAAPVEIPSEPRTRRTSEWVLVESPVRDPAGHAIGFSQVAVSLARENAAIRIVERRVLGLFAALAIGLSALLLSLAQLIIVRPLGKLAVAAKRLERGEHVALEVMAEDEVGALSRAFQSMSSAIEVREVQITARNRDMRLVLDNVEEGFVTIGRDGNMSDERSAILEQWFGRTSSPALVDYLTGIDRDLGVWFAMGWESVLEDLLPLEATLDQLPRRFKHDGRTYEIRYRPILEGEALSQLLVIVADVTARVERERAEISQREMVQVFQRVLADRPGFDEFVAEASALVEAIEQGDAADDVLRRHIHTLKGTAALFGLDRVVTFCHELESSGVRATVEERAALRTLWSEIEQMATRFSRPATDAIEIRPADYERLLQALDNRVDRVAISALVRSWQHEAIETRFARLREQVRGLAQRLQRGEVIVTWSATPLRMSAQRWGPFWSVMAHVVRNVVDHGIESAEERERSGKSGPATITLAGEEIGSEIVVTIADDGRGIDWPKIAAKAAARGLPHASKEQLEAALFADGVSTRDVASEVSGRGVGMGAVRAAVEALGGTIRVESVLGMGTTLRFSFPKALLDDAVVKAPFLRRPGSHPRLSVVR